jgi:hypothetical protein
MGDAHVDAEVQATYDLRPPPTTLVLYLMPFLLVGGRWAKLLVHRRRQQELATRDIPNREGADDVEQCDSGQPEENPRQSTKDARQSEANRDQSGEAGQSAHESEEARSDSGESEGDPVEAPLMTVRRFDAIYDGRAE